VRDSPFASLSNSAAKRVEDILLSGAALLALAPVLALIALGVRVSSPGPALFRQRRYGLDGRDIVVYKFRTMTVAEDGALAFTAVKKGDARVTRFGQFLRRTSLDELPQFWNVLHGEMSLVGPRPPLPAEVRQYLPWQRRRLSVKPGITCTWQVSGRNEIDFEHWMKLDLDYIDRWSFWGDVGICFQTIPAVLFARGAR
jgi:exopolysaccharide biosynthesis polyprenyl glycosylphosphotransferase